MEQKQRDSIAGTVATAIFHGMLLCMLLFWGYQKPYPPPGEEGILINFGNSQTGSGAEEPMSAKQIQPRSQQAAAREEQPHLTQDFEEAASIKQPRKKSPKPQPDKPTDRQEQPVVDQQPEKPQEKPREVNRSALFPGQGTSANQGHGDGSGSGNQGDPNGAEGGSSTGTGLGSGGSGASLAGRSLIGTLPEPDYRVQQSGKVIVRIKVDRDGNVIEAKADQRGSTVLDATLYDAAEKAARKAKFSTSPGSPIYQNGTITYVFKLGQ